MSLRHASLACFFAAFAAACGGAFSQGDDKGEGGSSSVGGGSSKGGSTSTSGKPSKAGSSSVGGASTAGGTTGRAGSPAVAGSTSMGGGQNCALVDCAYPSCADGQMPITPAGQCCPVCPPPKLGCSNVMCQPVMGCPGGYVLSQPPGACCQGCVPTGQVACLENVCPSTACPLGYIRGDRVGGCCYDCVPDALFCNDDSECVIADRPRSCCGCPQPITRREYDVDACWSDVEMPRPIPQKCYPQVVCDAICGACPPPLNAVCHDHHCSEVGLK